MNTEPSPFDDAVAALGELQRLLGHPGSGVQSEYRTLVAVDRWARKQLPIREGDLVELNGVKATGGWKHYAELLADGTCTHAGAVEFNPWVGDGGGWQVACAIAGKTFFINMDRLRKVNP